MRIFKRITALALAAVTAGAMGLSAAAEIEETTAEQPELKVYCPTNDDSEFPFNMYINVNEDSIQYIELDEPIYGFERLLDEEALEFDVNFSLKDEFKSFDSYTFTVFNSNYSEELASEQMASDGVLNLTGLSLGSGYKISMILESDSLNAYYGGHFTIQAELDSTLAVDLFYKLAGMDGEAALYIDDTYEAEPKNNNPLQPDTLFTKRPMHASTKKGDIDYFRYWCPYKMTGAGDDDVIDDSGIVNLSFTLIVPAWANITMELRNEDGSLVREALSAITGSTGQINYFKINNALVDTTYSVKITSANTSEISYTLTADYEFTLAWFGQYESKDVDGVYWNTDKLDTIEQYAAKANRYFTVFSTEYKNHSTYNGDVYATACGVVSSAMIFRNLGVTMTGYDYRTGYSGKLQADPFTAILSNCGYTGYELLNMKKSPNNPDKYLWPDYSDNDKDDLPDAWNNEIGDKFGLTYNPINNITETSLRNAISAHGYVLIYFDRHTDANHFMVLTRLDYGSGDFCNRAYVLDPASRTYSTGAGEKGMGVLLSKTASGHSNATIRNISEAGYFV